MTEGTEIDLVSLVYVTSRIAAGRGDLVGEEELVTVRAAAWALAAATEEELLRRNPSEEL